MTITGKNFGNADETSGLRFSTEFFPSSQCIVWSDEKITFTIPKNFSSCLLSVSLGNTSSEPIVLSAKNEIPKLLHKKILTSVPQITDISKQAGTVGQQITIKGNHFGSTRQDSDVFFTEMSETSFAGDENPAIEGVCCSDENLDYVNWSDTEITIHVPETAKTGNIVVRTTAGVSNAVSFTVQNRFGKKTVTNKRTIVLTVNADIKEIQIKSRDNSLFLYLPQPIESYMQQHITLQSTNQDIFAQGFQHSNIYKFENITEGSQLSVRETVKLETYDVTTNVDPSSISTTVKLKPEILNYVSSQSNPAMITESVKKTVNQIIGGSINPYNNAKKVYNYLVKNINIVPLNINKQFNVDKIIDTHAADLYELSQLYSIFLQAANIPCIQVAGIVIDNRQKTYTHWWNEFYIDGVGWIPVDVGLAIGQPFKTGTADFFGRLDGLHVAFSRGVPAQTQMISESTLVNKTKSFVIRQIWEESSGLSAYNSLWATPQLIAIY